MEKLKAQEDKEFREVHKICQQLESKFVDEQKANKVVDFKSSSSSYPVLVFKVLRLSRTPG